MNSHRRYSTRNIGCFVVLTVSLGCQGESGGTITSSGTGAETDTAATDGTTTGVTTTDASTTDTTTTKGTTTEPVDPCVVPPRAFVGLGADGRQIYDLPGDPPTGAAIPRWSYEFAQIGIEVSDSGDLYSLGQEGDAWVLSLRCYEDGVALEVIELDIPVTREITSMSWRQSNGIVVVAEVELPSEPGELARFSVGDDGATSLLIFPGIQCKIDGVDYYLPIIEFAASSSETHALANELDQFVSKPEDMQACINYAGIYADGGAERYQWMDFDPASYDSFFEVTYDLYGLSPTSKLYLRGLYALGTPQLVSTFSAPLRAFAIGPAS